MHTARSPDHRKRLTLPRREEIRRESTVTYQMQFIKPPRQLHQHREDIQGNNMHDRTMFGKHTQVCVYGVLSSPGYAQI